MNCEIYHDFEMIEEITVPPPPIFRILYNTTKLAGLERCGTTDARTKDIKKNLTF